ncbi:MAG: hypothetical protein K2W96_28250 [Gemmataceae bacterium]|nr:hypothetical protein [Gemmataceae bacterium]
MRVTSGLFDFEHAIHTTEEHARVNTETKEKTPGGRGVAGRNPRYGFELRRKGEGDYLLRRTVIFSSDEDRLSIPLGNLNVPYAVPEWGKTYLEVAQDAETVVHSAQETEWRGSKVFEVRLTSRFYHRGTKKWERATVVWYFDPKHWVCVGTKAVDPDPAQPEYEFVYSYDTSGEWAVPTKHELWEMHPREPAKDNRRRLVEILEFAPATDWDESKFRLSAFGLPEPVGVEWPKPTPRWVWLLVAAAGLAVLAVGFRWFARRREPQPA